MTSVIEIEGPDGEKIRYGAGFWIRAVARGVDMIVGGGVGLVAGIVAAIIGLVAGYGMEEIQAETASIRLLGYVSAILGSLIYETVCESLFGATLGKFICGLRVISMKGTRPGIIAAFVRNLTFFLDSIFFGVLAYSAMKETSLSQRWGDEWSKTVVVRASDTPSAAKRNGFVFVTVFVFATSLWVAIMAAEIFHAISASQ